jgi:hypothetical protein
MHTYNNERGEPMSMGTQGGAGAASGMTGPFGAAWCRQGALVGWLGGLCLAATANLATAAERIELTPRPFATPTTLPVTPFSRPAVKVPAAAAVAVAVAPAEPVVSAALPGQWEVKASDITLLRTIERWAATAGYKLKWDAGKNFLIGAPDVYIGSFEMALQSVLSSSGIRLSDYPLEACIYANTPPLVRITRQGEQVRECSAVAAE